MRNHLEHSLPEMDAQELGSITDLQAPLTGKMQYASTPSNSMWDPRQFDLLTTLKGGSHTTISLVKSSQTRQLFAMKAYRKKFLQDTDVESINTEKALLLRAKEVNSPWVVEVFGGFQTQSHVMLYLEFCQGGDLMHHLRTGKPFDLERTRFYAAEVCLALKWFHNKNMLYRSLSLDHILLGNDGYIRLVDFSVSKLDLQPGGRTKSFCGTSEFMAPEMLFDLPYGTSVDWWQLGIITYQMLTQRSPFQGDDEDDIYDAILSDEPLFPITMTGDSIDFIRVLLCKEPEKRLGSGIDGAEQVMAHAFFAGMNWDDLSHKRVSPPFIPSAADSTDASNFDSDETLDAFWIFNTEVVTSDVQEAFQGFEFSTE